MGVAVGMGWNTTFEACLREAVEGLPAGTPISADLPLRAYGLDSVGMIALAVSIEDAFAITIPDQALIPAAFGTPGTLWQVVEPLIGA